MVEDLEQLFPRLRQTGYQITSPPDRLYNCIAWTAGATTKWWWPLGDPETTHWPDNTLRAETLEAFRAAFATLGYVVCDGQEAEPGCEKIALYADGEGVPQHAARQLPNGRWTSKAGALEDFEHDLQALEGAVYGAVAVIMKRPCRGVVEPEQALPPLSAQP